MTMADAMTVHAEPVLSRLGMKAGQEKVPGTFPAGPDGHRVKPQTTAQCGHLVFAVFAPEVRRLDPAHERGVGVQAASTLGIHSGLVRRPNRRGTGTDGFPDEEVRMDARRRPFNSLSHFVHEHFLWLLLGSYVVAGLVPGLGLMIRASPSAR